MIHCFAAVDKKERKNGRIFILIFETTLSYFIGIMSCSKILTRFILFIILIQYNSMQPTILTVTHTINHLRSMVERDADRNDILVCIDSLKLQLKNSEKQQKDILSQLSQLRAENKKIKQKSKALGKAIGEREKDYQDLKGQLKIRNAICRKKSEQLLSVSDWTINKDSKSTPPQIQKANQGIQCQFLNWQLFQDVKQENNQLTTKISHLQRIYEEECNQSNAKQFYIEELLQSLDKEIVLQDPLINPENILQHIKVHDNQTIDADQLKEDDYQIPTTLEKTDSRDTEDSESQESQSMEVQCIVENQLSWLDTIWQKSSQLCNLILGNE